MKRKLSSVPQPSKAGADRPEQTVSVHGLAGSSFEREVNSGETGWNVAFPSPPEFPPPADRPACADIRCSCHRSRPATAASSPARRDHLLAGKTLSDVAALNATMSLTCHTLEGIQLPSTLQSLTLGDQLNLSLQGIRLPSRLPNLALCFSSTRAWRASNYPQLPAKCDVWCLPQPEFGGYPTTQQLSEFDNWC